MKKLLLLVAAVVMTATTFAQTTVDSKLVKADVGFGSGVSGMIPVGVSYEQGIYGFDDGAFITVGGYFGYAGKSTSYSYYDWKLRVINIMAQGNYYLKPIVNKLDIYAGLRLGYASITSKYEWKSGHESEYNWGSPFGYDIHVGVNYWFTDLIGVNAEVGYGIAYLNVGVGFKF